MRLTSLYGANCRWGPIPVAQVVLTTAYCDVSRGVASPAAIDVNVMKDSRRFTGRLVLTDNSLPTTSGGHVRVLVDGELLVEQDVIVSQEFALDLDVTSKRRVTLQVTVPDVYQDTVNLMSLAVVDGRFAVG